MKRHRRLLGIVAVLFGAGMSTGCLHGYKNGVLAAAPSGLVPGAAGLFNDGGRITHFGAAWFLWPIPVSPAVSYEKEKILDRMERDGVAILGPIRGEFSPVFCMDPPSEKEIYDALPEIPNGLPFVYEVRRSNVRFAVEKLVDQIDECKFYPLAGPCQLHHCHFKCTVWYEETMTAGWPLPWSHTDQKMEVIYIDKDHLHRCGEPGDLAPAGGATVASQY